MLFAVDIQNPKVNRMRLTVFRRSKILDPVLQRRSKNLDPVLQRTSKTLDPVVHVDPRSWIWRWSTFVVPRESCSKTQILLLCLQCDTHFRERFALRHALLKMIRTPIHTFQHDLHMWFAVLKRFAHRHALLKTICTDDLQFWNDLHYDTHFWKRFALECESSQKVRIVMT